MTWIGPIAIGGFLLAAGPVLIHILFRWRYRVVRFAAFRFLLESRRRNRQRLRLEELILILLRVLACILIGLMLADVRSAAAPVGGSAPTAHVFVLDDSLSMGQVAGGATLYQKAVAHVVGRLEAMPDGDSVAILSGSRPRSGEPLGHLVPAVEARRGDFAPRLTASKPTDLRADLPAALAAAQGLIASRQRTPVRLYVVSDFRRPDFSGADALAALRSAFAAFDPKTVEVHLLDFGLPCRSNLTIERVAVGRNVVVAGVSTPVRVAIRNTGTEPAPATTLAPAVGDQALPAQPVPSLPAGETAEAEFACTFDAPGGASVQVSLPADDLPADSTCALALDVRESLHILVLDGSDNPAEPGSASFALASALDPSGKGSFGRRLDVQSAATWHPESVSAYDLVILTNVRDFAAAPGADGGSTYPALRALEDYVRAGGGLAIFAGDRISPAFYNGPMYADGRGLSPLPLAHRPPPRPNPQTFVRLGAESIRDVPMLRVFARQGANFSRFVRFYAFVSASAQAAGPSDASGPARILATFDNGLPAVCRRAYGKGTVIMWYSSADTKWTNWPKNLSFLPVMNDMAWDLARVAENAFDDVVGRSIGYTLPARLSGTLSAVLKTPAYPTEDIHVLALQDDGRQRTVHHPEPPHAGLYEMTLIQADRTEHRVLFSRHTDPKESDLVRVPEAAVRALVGRDAVYQADLAAEAAPAGEATPLKALWWVFLAVLLAVLAGETVLGLRFAHYLHLPHARKAPESP